MKIGKFFLMATAIAGLLSASAHAERPLQTEDASVLARGDCDVQGVTQRLSVPGAHATETGLQFECGVSWGSQIAASVSSASAEGVHLSRIGVDGKTGLWRADGKDDAAALTLAWGLIGTKDSGDSWRHAGTELKLVFSAPAAANLTLHANLGHARDEQFKMGSTTWGLALEHACIGATQRWAPMGELFGDDREPPWWAFGLRFTAVPEKFFVGFSYGRQFASDQPTLVTLGFKAAF